MWFSALSAFAGMAVHVAAGHAASQGWAALASQWAHFAAAGIWIGGLAALLPKIRGAPSQAKSAMAGRFSRVAGAALVVVLATGIVRAFGELNSWADLVKTAYGRVVLSKIALIAAVASLGAFNRWRNLPRASSGLGRLRGASLAEVSLATLALLAAAFLGSASPPVAARPTTPGIIVSGSDFATTVKVRLSALSPRPGPNRFTLDLTDYDSDQPVAAQVQLRFFALDDPAGETSSLALERNADGTYGGVGTNLAFDGRWGVAALITSGKESVTVPMELTVENEPQHLSVLRVPGEPEVYTVQLGDGGSTIFWADPDRAGPSRLFAGFYDLFGSELPISHAVLTTSSNRSSPDQHQLHRLGTGSFAADLTLPKGAMRVALVGITLDGTRLRSVVDLEKPSAGTAKPGKA
jgi:copper resistance protein D